MLGYFSNLEPGGKNRMFLLEFTKKHPYLVIASVALTTLLIAAMVMIQQRIDTSKERIATACLERIANPCTFYKVSDSGYTCEKWHVADGTDCKQSACMTGDCVCKDGKPTSDSWRDCSSPSDPCRVDVCVPDDAEELGYRCVPGVHEDRNRKIWLDHKPDFTPCLDDGICIGRTCIGPEGRVLAPLPIKFTETKARDMPTGFELNLCGNCHRYSYDWNYSGPVTCGSCHLEGADMLNRSSDRLLWHLEIEEGLPAKEFLGEVM